MKSLEKKLKKVRSNVVQSMNSKEINGYLKLISENLSYLIKKDKITLQKENDNGKYENAYDLITNTENNNNDQILFLALITFHHKQGGVVELTFPSKEDIIASEKLDSLIDENNEKINSKELVLDCIFNNLINYCLIDGIHLIENGPSFFFIHDFPKILYCFSYYIQKNTDNDKNQIEDDFQENIRGCIQKAICIISTLPLFGNIITYENYYTHLSNQMTLYMNQKSLNDKSVLSEIYDKLDNEFSNERKWLFNIRKAFSILKDDLLIILKLIILEKRIIIFSQIPTNVSLLIMTLLSFFPANYSNGKLNFDIQNGVPFRIFYEKYLIYPLFTLFDLDNLLEKINNNNEINYLIGTTNNLVMSNKKLNYNCLINIDEQKIQYEENLNESIKIINGREHKLLLYIYELINQKIPEDMRNSLSSINSNNSNNTSLNANNKNIKNDESWIINYDNGNNSNTFHLIKQNIRFYYQKILYDISYLIYEMTIKNNNDPYKKLIFYYKNINQNFIKSLSQEETEIDTNNNDNNNAHDNDHVNENDNENDYIFIEEEEKLPHLEELIADPFSYILYTILPINFDNLYPNSDKNKTALEKKRESILSKINNLAVLSEWTKKRNFIKWYCSYKEQIMFFSSLNTKTAITSLYDHDDNFYKGSMLLGKKNGTGEFTYKYENMIYSGEYKNDVREGHGKLISTDGTYYYVGDWLDNKMEGNGILNSSKLGKYTGQFHKDYFEGKGHLIDLENNIYDGMFHKGMKKGKGELKLNNGNIYIGEFKNDKYNGKGIIKDSRGNIIQEGEYKDGIFVKSKKINNYKEDKFKDNISIISKESSQSIKVNPLNENEEIKLTSIQQNDSIDEDENIDKIIEKEKEEEEDKKEDKKEDIKDKEEKEEEKIVQIEQINEIEKEED